MDPKLDPKHSLKNWTSKPDPMVDRKLDQQLEEILTLNFHFSMWNARRWRKKIWNRLLILQSRRHCNTLTSVHKTRFKYRQLPGYENPFVVWANSDGGIQGSMDGQDEQWMDLIGGKLTNQSEGKIVNHRIPILVWPVRARIRLYPNLILAYQKTDRHFRVQPTQKLSTQIESIRIFQ